MNDPKNNDVLDFRVSALEKGFEHISKAVESIAVSLEALARLEEYHKQSRSSINRSFSEISTHDVRLRLLEMEMPLLKLVRGWVITGVIGIVAILGAAVIGLVFI